MPLSSSSLPSFISSNLAEMASPTAARLIRFSSSSFPNLAPLRERNIRPNRPSKDGDFPVDIKPRTGTACLELILEPSYCELISHFALAPRHRRSAVSFTVLKTDPLSYSPNIMKIGGNTFHTLPGQRHGKVGKLDLIHDN